MGQVLLELHGNALLREKTAAYLGKNTSEHFQS